MEKKRKLHILWTNANPNTSLNMVMLYATKSMLKGWWDEVTVIIWGDTAKYAAENQEIQASIKAAEQAGVKFSACIVCAVSLGVKEILEKMGIEVIPWGVPLTKLIQSNAPLISI